MGSVCRARAVGTSGVRAVTAGSAGSGAVGRCRQRGSAGSGAVGQQGSAGSGAAPWGPAPHPSTCPPHQHNSRHLPASHRRCNRREEPAGDVLTFVSCIANLACFLHFIFSSFRGETSPEAILISLSLFQPSFFTVTVGRRTDKGMRVTQAAVPAVLSCPPAVSPWGWDVADVGPCSAADVGSK